jgi:hypothetical protein
MRQRDGVLIGILILTYQAKCLLELFHLLLGQQSSSNYKTTAYA